MARCSRTSRTCTFSNASRSWHAGRRVSDMRAALLFFVGLLPVAANAQSSSDTFSDREDGAKVHVSGFVCPPRIGEFERDAVGEADPERNEDFCAYGALDGVYGTIAIAPLKDGYDPKAAFADDFREQEATGGKRLSEN